MSLSSNVHDLFINVNLMYAKKLEHSIDALKKEKLLKPMRNKRYYNYIIMDASALYKLLERFDTDEVCGLGPKQITLKDTEDFKETIIYIGKGCNDRKMKHMYEAKSAFEGKIDLRKINAKLTKITRIWHNGKGIVIIQIFSDSDHYISLCRENAMIKAAGNKLTNLISGSIYGLMKYKWTMQEIKKFGEMLLYFAFKQCITERPSQIFPKDIKLKNTVKVHEPKKYFIKTNYELNGILDCFLELTNDHH